MAKIYTHVHRNVALSSAFQCSISVPREDVEARFSLCVISSILNCASSPSMGEYLSVLRCIHIKRTFSPLPQQTRTYAHVAVRISWHWRERQTERQSDIFVRLLAALILERQHLHFTLRYYSYGLVVAQLLSACHKIVSTWVQSYRVHIINKWTNKQKNQCL